MHFLHGRRLAEVKTFNLEMSVIRRALSTQYNPENRRILPVNLPGDDLLSDLSMSGFGVHPAVFYSGG